jgi:cholesterol transport system auxiliary component
MKRALFVFFLLLPLAGCFKLQRPYPEREFFTLESNRMGTRAPSPAFGPLQVDKFRVPSPFGGKAFFYRTGELSYEEDFYNRFVAPPGELLAANVTRWLDGSGLFAAVYGGPSPAEPALFLSSEVTALYGDYRKRPALGVLEITFTLAGGGGKVLLHRTYRQEVSLEEGSSAGLAAGWSKGLGKILTVLEGDLRELPSGAH